MEIKSREKILQEIIELSKSHPEGWSVGTRRDRILHATEHYILHPSIGIYELKEYQVNPFKARGVGGILTKDVDSDIAAIVDKEIGRFAIIELNARKILRGLEKNIPLSDLLLGKSDWEVAVNIPVEGPAFLAQKPLASTKREFSEKQRIIDLEFRKLLDRDGITKAYA